MANSITASERAIDWVKKMGGVIRTKDALSSGIHWRILKQLLNEGILEQISRGVYRLVGDPVSAPDLVTVATRIPKGVICLISALSFHKITTQIPHAVDVALERHVRSPRLDFPPLAIHRFSGKAFSEGIEKHKIDGVEIKIYSREKTLADCFKFRNQIGMDVVLESLKIYKTKKFNIDSLLHYAKTCKVEKIMMPYLEAMAYE